MENEEESIYTLGFKIIKKKKVKVLWFLVFIFFCLSVYKVKSYKKYKYYVSEYNKHSNYYYAIDILRHNSNYYAKKINFQIKEYYFMPLEGEFIAVGNGGKYEGKEVYGVLLKFNTRDDMKTFFSDDEDKLEKIYITDKKELDKIKESKLVYKFNYEQITDLLIKIEEKSEEIEK